MLDLLPVVSIFLFWLVVFIAAFWSFSRMLKVPTEAELELAHEAVPTEDSAAH